MIKAPEVKNNQDNRIITVVTNSVVNNTFSLEVDNETVKFIYKSLNDVDFDTYLCITGRIFPWRNVTCVNLNITDKEIEEWS